MPMLEVRHLCKELGGTPVLRDVSLCLEGGAVYGLMGDNGSGKTMLMRAICGLIRPTAGEVLFDGKTRREADPQIGVMLENTSLYPDLSGLENLRLFAKIRRRIKDEEIRRAICRVGLDPADRRAFRKYSLGMKQRLALAQAIMEPPEILLLDEPTNAIDRDGVRLVHQIMQEEAERGALVLLASHIDVDIRALCRRVYLMDHGVLTQEVRS